MLYKQTRTLVGKNIRIVLFNYPRTTVFRAFVLPSIFVSFLAFSRNLFIPPSKYGIGEDHAIRSLAEGLEAASGGRDTLALVNNGFSGGYIDAVIEILAQSAVNVDKPVVRLDSPNQLLDTCKSSLQGTTHCYGAVVFESSPDEGPYGMWNYTLRADGSLGEKIVYNKDNNDIEVYLLPLQRAVDFAIASVNTTIDQSALPNTTYEYIYTSITQEQRNTNIRVNFQSSIINVLAVAFLLSLIGVTYHLTGFIATERERGMSQLLEAMMPNLRRWEPQLARILSYHIAFDIMYLPGWILMALILGGSIFSETSMALVVIFNILAGLSFSSFSIFGSSFFKKAQLSGITVALVMLILGIAAQVVDKSGTGEIAILAFLFPPCNFVFYIVFLARYERQKQAASLLHSAPKNPWTLPGIVFWVFAIIHIIVYPLLGAMIENYFFGTKSKGRSVASHTLEQDQELSTRDDMLATVQLRNFSKDYTPNWFRRQAAFITNTPKATVSAVKDLTLTASRGQILVLLGANGSGKSTTLDAIAGLNTVTSGTIRVDGTGGLGIAPQKNVLWDELTVREHITIFNKLKSPSRTDNKQAIKEFIKTIDLDRKSKAKAKTLSGGQKRKLQLGMMFTGGSSVCCVDEVSSGLDPISRRKIWDILLAERGTRTIILTTHFLDEADLLADRIAILSKGTLRAEGSSAELKDLHGGGYRVNVQSGTAVAPHINGLTKKTAFGQTMYSATSPREVAQALRTLETVDLTDYQISGPTIEDVFLNLADEIHDEGPTTNSRELHPETSRTENRLTMKTSSAPERGTTELDLHSGRKLSFIQQAWVLFRKRFTVLRRNYLPYTSALLLPIIAAGITTVLLKGFKSVGCDPDIDASEFSTADIYSLLSNFHYDIVAGPPSAFSEASLESLYGPILPGLGVSSANIASNITLVNSLPDFNNYINVNFGNVTPAGFYVDNAPTLAYRGDGDLTYGLFGQNLLNTRLTNISIGMQYSIFDIPWVPSTGKSLQLTVYFGLAMAVYPAFFALYPTTEKIRNVRGLQFSNGVRAFPMWLSYLAFDFVAVLASSTLCVIIYAAATSAWYHIGYLFLVFILYGLTCILMAYLISLFARSQLSAFAITAAMQAIMFLIYLIAYLCTLTYAPAYKVASTLNIVHFAISIVTPMGSLIRALLVSMNVFSSACSGKSLSGNPGGILYYGGPIVYLIVQPILLFAMLIWYESGSVVAWYQNHFTRSKKTHETAPRVVEDTIEEEILQELERARSSSGGLQVMHLTKSFGKLTAVEDLTFSIEKGEVFALLGPNGAGKSTTVSLIRGDIQPSKNGGEILVENIKLRRHRAGARAHLGVCPQFDAMDQMTVLEHLRFYARIRGVIDSEHNVQAVIKAVGLQAFADRMAAKLSGGNKRKLSLGIALIGNPEVVLLDEPSSGMDAAAKRMMWKTLAAIVPGRCLLLTTHSMEEADALADRAGIMAKRMLAMGTSDYLRHKHGNAFYVHLVLKSAPHTTSEELTSLRSWVLTRFPAASLEDKMYHGQMRFSVPVTESETEKLQTCGSENARSEDIEEEAQSDADNISDADKTYTPVNGIGSVIKILEDHREELGLQHYSVSPTTLDQVFLTIVGKHNIEEENAGSHDVKKAWYQKLRLW